MSYWTQGLNPEQQQAVEHVQGPLLILAGAGSGKTTVLVARTGRLIDVEKIPPQRICVLTFTNKAARELKERVAAKIGAGAKGLWAGTFHAFGLQFLKRHHQEAGLPRSFGVLGGSDSVGLIKELAKNINVAGKTDFDAEKVLSLINDWRGIGRRQAVNDDEYEILAEVLLPKYVEQMDNLGVVDFEGLLIKPLEICQRHPEILAGVQEHFLHVMVDEFQDTNGLQMHLVRALSDGRKNIAVVGDDDQSIYGWRGAEVSNILDFPKLYRDRGCRVVRLERNYRSTPEILAVANSVIEKNPHRHEKILRPGVESRGGERPEIFAFEHEDEEVERTIYEIERLVQAEGLKLSEMAILYRSNSQGALFEASLRKLKIPYRITGGTAFFDRKEAKDILAYLRCSLRPNEVALRRILNTPPRGIGSQTLKAIEHLAQRHKLSFYKALCRWKEAGVTEAAGQSIAEFLGFLYGFKGRILDAGNSRSSGQILLDEMQTCGYRSYLERTSKDQLAFQKRWGFVEIFARVLDAFVSKGGKEEKTLRDFVEAMELRDADADEDAAQEQLQLMTLHASKGLEFPVVFLVGLEEDILPHRTLGGDISEERRLFYVGVTRAKRKLIMSRAQQRRRYGQLRPAAPSRFLLEIPKNLVRHYERGVRPVTEGERKTKLSDLMSALDSQIESQRIKGG